jgi:hypothetical protein
MHTQHALSIARQHQADLRRGALTDRLGGLRGDVVLAAASRHASRRRRKLGWLLVEVGLQLAVDRPEEAAQPAPVGERQAAA